MFSGMPYVGRFGAVWKRSLVAAVLLIGFTDSAPQPVMSNGRDCMATIREVRLRKLHLVRPDLIPYPVSYDIYC